MKRKMNVELKEKYAGEGLDEDIITDTIINTGLLLKVRNQYYTARRCCASRKGKYPQYWEATATIIRCWTCRKLAEICRELDLSAKELTAMYQKIIVPIDHGNRNMKIEHKDNLPF